jgi:hypothetical protein
VKLVGRRKWFGRTNSGTCLIELSSRCKDDEELWHTFLHEVNHAIFYAMGKDKLHADEALVDGHAGLLLQVLRTSE